MLTQGALQFRYDQCLLGHDADKAPQQSRQFGVRIIEPICDVMGIPHVLINQDSDVAKIKPAIDKAYKESFPVAILIGRSPIVS